MSFEEDFIKEEPLKAIAVDFCGLSEMPALEEKVDKNIDYFTNEYLASSQNDYPRSLIGWLFLKIRVLRRYGSEDSIQSAQEIYATIVSICQKSPRELDAIRDCVDALNSIAAYKYSHNEENEAEEINNSLLLLFSEQLEPNIIKQLPTLPPENETIESLTQLWLLSLQFNVLINNKKDTMTSRLQAKQSIEKAISICDNYFPESYTHAVIQTYYLYAMILNDLGRPKEALSVLRKKEHTMIGAGAVQDHIAAARFFQLLGKLFLKDEAFSQAINAINNGCDRIIYGDKIPRSCYQIFCELKILKIDIHIKKKDFNLAIDTINEISPNIKGLIEQHSDPVSFELWEDLFQRELELMISSHNFLLFADIIKEYLDIHPSSYVMVSKACKALNQAFEYELIEHKDEDIICGLEEASEYLNGLIIKFFSGTVKSIILRAKQFASSGDYSMARRSFENYFKKCPKDPEGYFEFANFLLEADEYNDAFQYYIKGEATKIQYASEGKSPDELACESAKLGEALLCMQLKVLTTDLTDIQSVLEKCDALHSWLIRDFVKSLIKPINNSGVSKIDAIKEEFISRLDVELDAVWELFSEKRIELINKFIQKEHSEIKTSLLNFNNRVITSILNQVAIEWNSFQESIDFSLNEIINEYMKRWGNAGEDEKKQLELDIEERISRLFRQQAEKMAKSVVDNQLTKFDTIFGEHWRTEIDESCQKYLAMSQRWITETDTFAPIIAAQGMGLALEWMLSNKLFYPLRELWEELSEKPELKKEPHHKPIALFLENGRPIMLGTMISHFISALKHADQQTDDHRDIMNFLMKQNYPNPTALYVDNNRLKKRASSLEQIKNMRNACAHPRAKLPPMEEIQNAWRMLTDESMDGFFHYYLQALKSPL